MRGKVLVACGLACLSLGAERVRQPLSAQQLPRTAAVPKSAPTDIQIKPLRELNMPIVVVPTPANPPDTATPAYKPGPLSDDKMQQTYLSPEGVVLWASTLKEPLSLSRAHVHHVVATPDTTVIGASASQDFYHEMRYARAANSESVLVVGVFNQIASGSHEYIFSLSASHSDGPLKDQVKIQIQDTQIRPEDVFAVSNEQIAVKFTYDPGNYFQGNQVTIFVTYPVELPRMGVSVMNYRKAQLLMK